MVTWKDIHDRYHGKKFVKRTKNKQITIYVTGITWGCSFTVYFPARQRRESWSKEKFLDWIKQAKEISYDRLPYIPNYILNNEFLPST